MQNESLTPLAERARPSVAAACILVLISAAGLWLGSLMLPLFPVASPERAELLGALLYYLPFNALPLAVCLLRRRGLSEGLRLNPMPLLPTLSVAFMAVLCVYGASAIDSLWVDLLGRIGLHEPWAGVEAAASPQLLTMQVIASAAIPAVCEELLFRGAVLSAFEGRGTRFGIWVSAALFALLHGNLFGLPAYLVVGAISGFIVYALDSLYAGMLFHTVYNAAILVIVYLVSGQELPEQAAAPVSPLAVALDVLFVGLMVGFTLMTLNLRRRAAGIEPIPRTRIPYNRKERWLMGVTLAVLLLNNVVSQALVEAGV